MPKTLTIDQFVKAQAAAATPASQSTGGDKPLSIEEFATKKNQATAKPVPATTISAPPRNLLETVGDFVAPTATKSVEKLMRGEGLDLRDIGGSALEIGSLALPATAGLRALGLGARGLKALTLAERIGASSATGAISGGLAGGGRAIGEGQDLGGVIGSAAGGAVGGGIFGAALPALGTSLGAAGRFVRPRSNTGAGLVDNIISKNAAGKVDEGASEALSSLEQKRLEAAGKVVQGDRGERAIAAKVLPTVDTQGVETFSDLSSRIGKSIDTKLKGVDKEFATNQTPTKLKDLAQTIEVKSGDKTLKGKVNYVQDALEQLQGHYTSVKDVFGTLRIKALLQKAKTTGLTPGEVNELAKEHGRVLKGFNANGQLASGLTKQASENTRTGLKETARSFLTSDAAKTADKEASDLIKIKGLVDDMAEKVNTLQQKVETRSPLQKVGRVLGTGVDIATGGLLKSFMQRLFVESNVGNKSMNALQIQENLAKYLKILNQIEQAPKSAQPSLLKEFLSGAASAVPKP